MATQTWGVDADFIVDALASTIRVSADAVATNPRLERLISRAAGRVNGNLIRIGIDPLSVDEAEFPDQWNAVQDLLWSILEPSVIVMIQGPSASESLVTQRRLEGEERLAAFRRNPSVLGFGKNFGRLGGQPVTSTATTGITSTTCRNARSRSDYCKRERW